MDDYKCDFKDYKCSFENDAMTVKKAKEELHEIFSDRESAVQALREWAEKQDHLKTFKHFRFLLKFLRGAKFSQLRAREILEGYCSNFMEHPKWFANMDPCSKPIDHLLSIGYGFPLPGYDKMGRKVLFYRINKLRVEDVGEGKKLSIDDVLRYWLINHEYATIDEKVQVNGFILFFDYTNVSLKQMNLVGGDKAKTWNKLAQDRLPGRLKGFHLYNSGAVIEFFFALAKPILKKKYLERFFIHENLESVYDAIDKKYLPSEYLPDEYDGPSVGSCAELAENFKKDLQSPKWIKYFQELSNGNIGFDKTKKLKKDEPAAMFRKLTVD